eukprot:TRINITY_DN244_c0_g1_i1.p1 TRINITY_DN244_c0_g1~~TRINITY_DN244_c0_g1_i1.p1  ORF type:complete len:105 (-),score=9.21 TRINITY_DN244_c0_g1_i1:140-454(-)
MEGTATVWAFSIQPSDYQHQGDWAHICRSLLALDNQQEAKNNSLCECLVRQPKTESCCLHRFESQRILFSSILFFKFSPGKPDPSKIFSRRKKVILQACSYTSK